MYSLKTCKCRLLEAGLRTAAVLVKIMQRVETRLLLLICLERVTGLQIGVLHDPAGPEGQGGKKQNIGHNHNPKLDTHFLCTALLYLFFISLKPVQKLKATLAFLDTHKYLFIYLFFQKHTNI